MLIDSKHVLAMGGLAGVMLLMSSAAAAGSKQQSIPVSGSGMDLASDAIVHSEESTPTGMIKRLTENVRLTRDLVARSVSGHAGIRLRPQHALVTGTNFFSERSPDLSGDPSNLRIPVLCRSRHRRGAATSVSTRSNERAGQRLAV